MDTKLLNQLNSIDWNFFNKAKELSIKIHWYPGTFPQEIPSALIQSLSKENDIIFDPYGGIGTTLAEALRLGRKCIFTEINPVGLLAAYTSSLLIILKGVNEKLTEKYVNFLQYTINKTLGNEKNILFEPIFNFSELEGIAEKHIYPSPKEFIKTILINKPCWDILKVWIDPHTLNEIKKLYSVYIENNQYPANKITLLTMLSNIIYSCSSQTRSWGHIADKVMPRGFIKKSVLSSCNRWLNRIKKLVRTTSIKSINKTEIRAWIIFHDWNDEIIKGIPLESTTVLLTSPPYANAIDYIRSQRLSLYLFGYDDDQINILGKNEIGARRKRFDKESINKWATSLEYALKNQMQTLKKDAFSAFILPHEDSGRDLGTHRIREYIKSIGGVLIFNNDRSIDQLNTMQAWTSIKKETILVFKHKG